MEIENLPPDDDDCNDEKDQSDNKNVELDIKVSLNSDDDDDDEDHDLRSSFSIPDLSFQKSAWDDLGMVPSDDVSPWGELVKMVYGNELFDDPDNGDGEDL